MPAKTLFLTQQMFCYDKCRNLGSPVLMSLLEFFGLETTDMPNPDLVLNAIETAIGLLILGILALIYLLGLIPNPFHGRRVHSI